MTRLWSLKAALLLLFVSAAGAPAQDCGDLTHLDCALSELCTLDHNADGTRYLCRPAADRCEIGYRQHLTREEAPRDDPGIRCTQRPGCRYQEAESCYCPRIPGVICICDGGRPHLCQNEPSLARQPPVGEYVIVDLRTPWGVAAKPRPPGTEEAIGAHVALSENGLSLPGLGCDSWEIRPSELVPRPEGTDLLDVFLGPVPVAHSDGDKRILQSWSYICEGTDAIELTEIDPQIVLLHFTDPPLHAVLERKIDPETVRRMQAALADVKFYGGPIDGILGEDTLRAAAFWAESRMQDGRRILYARPALTRNLFDTMRVFD